MQLKQKKTKKYHFKEQLKSNLNIQKRNKHALEITEATCFSLENQTNELEIKSLFNATFKFTELIIRNKQNNF